MKKLTLILLIILGYNNLRADYWTQKANFPNGHRESPFGFAINGKGYMGFGWNYVPQQTADLWEYDPVTNLWTQKSSGGLNPWQRGISFSIGNYGYLCLGEMTIGTSGFMTNDLWQYNPVTDSWSQKAAYPGGAREDASVFTLNGKAYAGLGITYPQGSSPIYHNDWYEYNPVTNTWASKAPFPGNPRASAFAFSGSMFGYVGGGLGDIPPYGFIDCYGYYPLANAWSQLPNIPVPVWQSPSSFNIQNQGYVTGGWPHSMAYLYSELWMFNTLTNSWVQKTDFPDTTRGNTVSFSIGNNGYICGGITTTGGQTGNFDELWEYTADSLTGINNLQASNNFFEIYPNPANHFIEINFNDDAEINCKISIFDASGKIVYNSFLKNNKTRIDIDGFSKGTFVVTAFDGTRKNNCTFINH